MSDLTRRLDEHVVWIASALGDARAAGLPLQEEAVTEFLLARLAGSAVGSSFRLRVFTKQQESRIGADFELVLRGPGLATLPLRIQAKRESSGRLRLGHESPTSGRLQLVDLVVDGVSSGMLPFVAVYSAPREVPHLCPTGCAWPAIPDSHASVGLVSAIEALRVLFTARLTRPNARTIPVGDLKVRCVGLGCLTRCLGSMASPPGPRPASLPAVIASTRRSLDDLLSMARPDMADAKTQHIPLPEGTLHVLRELDRVVRSLMSEDTLTEGQLPGSLEWLSRQPTQGEISDHLEERGVGAVIDVLVGPAEGAS